MDSKQEMGEAIFKKKFAHLYNEDGSLKDIFSREEETPVKVCHPCNGKGRHLEKLDDDDPGAWFECACCNGTGINQHGTSEAVKES